MKLGKKNKYIPGVPTKILLIGIYTTVMNVNTFLVIIKIKILIFFEASKYILIETR